LELIFVRSIMEDENKTEKELTAESTELRERLAEITEKGKSLERSEEAVKTVAEEWRRVFDAMSDFIVLIDRQYRVVKVNKALADRLRVGADELVGLKCYKSIHGTDEPPDFCRYGELLEDKAAHTAEFYDEKLGGYLEVTSSPVFNDSGELAGSLHVIRDINERKRVEDALRKGEERYRNLFEHAYDAILVRDLYGKIVAANSRAGELFGYPLEQLHQMKLSEILVLNAEAYAKVMSGEGVVVEAVGFRNDGTEFPIEASVRLTYWGDEEALLFFVRDLRERKRAEEALRESEEKFRELANSLPETVFETDAKGNLTFINREAFNVFGYSEDDFQAGLNVFDMFPEDEVARARENFSKVIGGVDHGITEYNVLKKDGTPFHIAIYSVPIIREDKPVGSRGIIIDITQQKRIEEELLKAAKLESVGVLAGGIAHDFNNLLAVILGNVSYVKSNVRTINCERVVEALSATERATLRAKDLTEQLLTFSQGGIPVKETINLVGIVEESAAFSARGTNVRCVFETADGLWPVDADESQIGQVINNLVINAVQAMPEGGEVRVRCENYVVGNDSTAGSPALREGKYVKISVEDTGVGIPQEYIQKIFDPFFTTKYKGSGLGLSTSYSVVRNHGGLLTVESDVGVGSTFMVYLPASDKSVKESKIGPYELVPGEGKILVMDDEFSIRELVGKVLTGSGYEVEFAEDGAKAVEMYKNAVSSGEPYDAVLLDLTVPGGVGGAEAVKELLAVDPNAKVIVSSGYSTDPVLANYKSYGFRGFIKKPFHIANLTKTVRAIIQGT
jgi:PAS domain S-box-containing protein